jgi:hypothetical protein
MPLNPNRAGAIVGATILCALGGYALARSDPRYVVLSSGQNIHRVPVIEPGFNESTSIEEKPKGSIPSDVAVVYSPVVSQTFFAKNKATHPDEAVGILLSDDSANEASYGEIYFNRATGKIYSVDQTQTVMQEDADNTVLLDLHSSTQLGFLVDVDPSSSTGDMEVSIASMSEINPFSPSPQSSQTPSPQTSS